MFDAMVFPFQGNMILHDIPDGNVHCEKQKNVCECESQVCGCQRDGPIDSLLSTLITESSAWFFKECHKISDSSLQSNN